MTAIAPPRGTKDILPSESAAWRWLLDTHRRVVEGHGYQAIETPIFESTELFARGVGADTDIVEKQMFTFSDRGGRSLTLRPEGTAGVVRAVAGNRLDQEIRPLRVHYAGPFFRAERPQAGRQHQFTQIGIECIGDRSPELDVEVIEIANSFFAGLGITGLKLQINSLGTPDDRSTYRRALVDYYRPHRDELCDDCRRRLETNPLRLLDCKTDQRFVAGAPMIWDSLSEPSRVYFTAVQAGLEHAGVDGSVNPRLVRGLDYYTDTTFEFWHETLHGAQNALGGGGRYDGLAELLGLPATPGIGYALGVERTLIVARALGTAPGPAPACEVVVCALGPASTLTCAAVARTLRSAGVRTVLDASDRRLDRKLRNADRLGARVCVIVGDDEVAAGTAAIRDLRDRSQHTAPQARLEETILSLLETSG